MIRIAALNSKFPETAKSGFIFLFSFLYINQKVSICKYYDSWHFQNRQVGVPLKKSFKIRHYIYLLVKTFLIFCRSDKKKSHGRENILQNYFINPFLLNKVNLTYIRQKMPLFLFLICTLINQSNCLKSFLNFNHELSNVWFKDLSTYLMFFS